MHDVAVIEDSAAAEISLDPIRARLLAELAEPGSATTLAARVGLTRQKANYHLRALERHGLVELVDERRSLRSAGAGFVDAVPVQPQMQRAPVERTVERGPFVLRHAGRLRDVGQEAGVGVGEDRLELAPDLIGAGFQLLEPGKMVAIEEFVGGEERVVKSVTLVHEDPAATGHYVRCGVHAAIFPS